MGKQKQWTDRKIKKTITDLVDELKIDYMPTKDQLKMKLGLYAAIGKAGGVRRWTEEMGLPPAPRKYTEYAVYRGDEFLFIGTRDYCAKRLRISENSFRHMNSPTYRNRIEDGNGIYVVNVGKEGDYPQDYYGAG